EQIVNYVCVFSDITEIKESQARLDFLAHHDTLTGLPNRLLFRARLEHSLERAGRSKYQIAVMFIDLDHFKDVNDALGHAAGDQLLIDLAGAMTGCLRAEDTLARLGGDEFVVLLEQVSGHDSVDAVLEKFRQVYPWAMGEPSQRIAVTASVGVALYPDNAVDADGLLLKADAAMYRAKENGRNQACYA
ncbi:MAG TPA: GGDEF domain-containing protein, partial [Rhodocyclaceae bacterium]|nr:GGDEF domain-containing protein [Rhodocyclaceae bacterium]